MFRDISKMDKTKMNMTDTRFLQQMEAEQEERDDAKSRKSFKSLKSIGGKSGKTMFTSRNRAGTHPKVVTTGGLAPVGMKPPAYKKSMIGRAAELLEKAVPTKVLIDNILENFYEEEDQDEKIDWPVDSNHNPKIKKTLSYSKMVNEVNHREPRAYTNAGQIEEVPVFGSKAGWHSTSKDWRESHLD
jgi:hypothetical protein